MTRRDFIIRLTGFLAAGSPILIVGDAFAKARAEKRKPIIVVDPGHGGVDPGAIGPSGLLEKDVVLDVAKRCAAELTSKGLFTVQLTRTKDVFLPLPRRISVARAHKADLFISIHADSAPSASARGLSIYTLSEQASDELSAAIADRENAVDKLYDVNLSQLDETVASILFDLARRETLNTSSTVQNLMLAQLKTKMRLLENPARHANFTVLRSIPIPSVLVEAGFLSNPNDENKLRSPQYRRFLGTEIARSLGKALSAVSIV